MKKICPRVYFRMECIECGYPYSEALFSLNTKMPHLLTKNKKEIKQIIMQYFQDLSLIEVEHYNLVMAELKDALKLLKE